MATGPAPSNSWPHGQRWPPPASTPSVLVAGSAEYRRVLVGGAVKGVGQVGIHDDKIFDKGDVAGKGDGD